MFNVICKKGQYELNDKNEKYVISQIKREP